MTVVYVTLQGGPPWGLRLGNDEELRPVVTKILMGGRASCAGVQVGDVLRCVNTNPVVTCKQAYALMQKSSGRVILGLARNSNSARASVSSPFRGDVKSSYAGNSNIFTNSARYSQEKGFRPDFEGYRGSTKSKRRFFEEQIAKNSVTDRLLVRKIQLGMLQNGAPSESTAGYDSVEADFAGGRSTATSLRTSPSLVAFDELDEITIVENPSVASANSTNSVRQSDFSMLENDPRCETVTPERQSVAEIRRQITSRLEMKSPETVSRRSSLRTEASTTPVPFQDFQHSFIKVHEVSEPEYKKPSLGRVLDDAVVSPEKFYQGVAPPSYLQSHPPAPCRTPDSKPPMAPPSKSQSRQHTKQNSFLNRIARESSPLPKESIQALVHNETNETTTQEKPPHILKESQTSSSDQIELTEPPSPLHMMPTTEKNLNTVFHTDTTAYNKFEEDRLKQQLATVSNKDGQSLSTGSRTPDPLKSRSPAPFTPTTFQRQFHSDMQQSTLLQDDLITSLTNALASLTKSNHIEPPNSNITNDSGYDGSTIQNSETTATRDSTLSETKFELPSGSTEHYYQLAQESAEHPLSTPSALRNTSTSKIFERKQENEDCSMGGPNATNPSLTLRDATRDRNVDGPFSQSPEMSAWYRNMFKKMHKIESPSESSILRHRLRESSPALTISRPVTPLSSTAHTPTRFECEVTPRRSRSVGRIVDPTEFANDNTHNLLKLDTARRTIHYHLPSYRFVHEDPRLIISKCRTVDGHGMYGVRCLRCGLPRKDPTWEEIDATLKSIFPNENRSLEKTKQIQSRVVLRHISENLEDTARELSQYIQRLDDFWRRSHSSPQLSACGCSNEGESSSRNMDKDIADLKRISKEEMLYRQKAERLAEELQEQRNRRHGYIPSASPSLLLNKDRFNCLLDEYSCPNSSLQKPISVRTATALFRFDAKSSRELSLNRGDIVRIRREVDMNWLEGERNGQCGLFPRSYVQIDDEIDFSRTKAKAIYPFTSRRDTELGLKMGELVTIRREIDENWLEGTNHLGEIGIFPRCYVQFVDNTSGQSEEFHNGMTTSTPDRPKTPKLLERDEYFTKPNKFSAASAHQTPSFSQNVNYVDNQLTKTGFPDRRVDYGIDSRPSSTKAEAYWCTADKIPKGSQTYRALYKYTPMKSDEVSLEVNDIIFVVEKCDDGWYIGTVLRTGEFGTFPGNYVEKH